MASESFRKLNPHLYRPAETESAGGGDDELRLHYKIIRHCRSQWPRWKYIHGRTDHKSTIQVGAPDFVIFLPDSKVLCVECKAKGGKLSADQLAWKKEMSMLGQTIHVVRSFDEFLKLVSPATQTEEENVAGL